MLIQVHVPRICKTKIDSELEDQILQLTILGYCYWDPLRTKYKRLH